MTDEPEPPPVLCDWDSRCLYRARHRLVKGERTIAVCKLHLPEARRQGWAEG